MSTSSPAHLDYAAAALAHFDRSPNGAEAGRRGIIAAEALRILLHEPVNGWKPEAEDFARVGTEYVSRLTAAYRSDLDRPESGANLCVCGLDDNAHHVNQQIAEHFRRVDDRHRHTQGVTPAERAVLDAAEKWRDVWRHCYTDERVVRLADAVDALRAQSGR